MKIKNMMIALVLMMACLIVIVNYIYLQHKTRSKFIELQVLIDEEIDLNADWGRLQIEHSYYVNNSKIEKQAKNQLGMKLPDSEHILSIKR